MTNKERYQQAFSALPSSRQLHLEVEEMAQIQKKHKKYSSRSGSRMRGADWRQRDGLRRRSWRHTDKGQHMAQRQAGGGGRNPQ